MKRETNPALFKSGYIDRELAQNELLPTGPIGQDGDGGRISLLVFVPRNEISTLINDLTGGYGYSHLAVDCGEIDIPSGKRVMIESTVGLGVHTSFQDEYGERRFARIYLGRAGINTAEFCDCIRSKLGEKYDDEEALTLGLLHNPAKQTCSDLATVCLPEATCADISRSHQAGLLHALSAVRVYGRPEKHFRLFVSPNGFAEYFGAPRGEKLESPEGED
jgi:hypothetical protein